MKNQLDNFREEIDKIDNSIIDLLVKRFQVVKKVGTYKKKNNIAIYDQYRFEKILLNQIKKAEKLGISEKLIKSIYQAIHEEAFKIEKSI